MKYEIRWYVKSISPLMDAFGPRPEWRLIDRRVTGSWARVKAESILHKISQLSPQFYAPTSYFLRKMRVRIIDG